MVCLENNEEIESRNYSRQNTKNKVGRERKRMEINKRKEALQEHIKSWVIQALGIVPLSPEQIKIGLPRTYERFGKRHVVVRTELKER